MTLIHLIDPDDEEKGGCLWLLLEGMATTAIIVMGVMMVYRYFYGGWRVVTAVLVVLYAFTLLLIIKYFCRGWKMITEKQHCPQCGFTRDMPENPDADWWRQNGGVCYQCSQINAMQEEEQSNDDVEWNQAKDAERRSKDQGYHWL
jgi:hypothetical protein